MTQTDSYTFGLASMSTFTKNPRVDSTADRIERLVSEKLIDMKAAAQFYTSTTHKATAIRHATKGVRLADGSTLKLEAIMVGGRLMTSRAAVLRFFAAQNATPTTEPAPLPRSPHARNRAAQAAAEELDALGVK
ncbi:MAG: hypothetical protein C0467_29860 [Planctomycetaceae bacterium]|nr:hypothetical protein [Planctomycetaceae bacterium]